MHTKNFIGIYVVLMAITFILWDIGAYYIADIISPALSMGTGASCAEASVEEDEQMKEAQTAQFESEQNSIQVPVLLYHHITNDYNINDSHSNITPIEFEAHMRIIKEKGYNTISLSEYADFITNNEELPPKPVIITFDDGYLSNYIYAFPILSELTMKASIFIVTDTVGKTVTEGVNHPHFTWAQAKIMEKSGVIDIQSHTHTHKNLLFLSESEVETELKSSKELVEANLNKTCDMIAYPYGGYNDNVIETAENAGYIKHILVNKTNENGISMANMRKDGLKEIKRITVFGHMSAENLIEEIENSVKRPVHQPNVNG